MIIIFERFGRTYTFEVPEGQDEVREENVERSSEDPSDTSFLPPQQLAPVDPDSEMPEEICLLDAIDAINNLLRCTFPEMEGHHLELVCEHPEDEEPTPNKDGGIDIG
jgi:hypothetical protein